MKKEKCQICNEPTQEISIILNNLKRRLIHKSKRKDQEYQELKSDQKNNHIQIFAKMIDVVIYGQSCVPWSCTHRKTYRDFYRKTRCSQSEFKRSCEQILIEVANRCFQLDTIAHQISFFEDRVFEFLNPVKLDDSLDIMVSKKKTTNIQQINPIKTQPVSANHLQIILGNDLVDYVQKIEKPQQIPMSAQGGIFYWPFLHPPFLRN